MHDDIDSIVYSVFALISLFLIFFIVHSYPPTIIITDPLSINESFSINDSPDELIKDIAIKNIGPKKIYFSAMLEKSAYTNYIVDLLRPYEKVPIESGEAKFLSVKIDISNGLAEGGLKTNIILKTDDGNIRKIIPVSIKTNEAKSSNDLSQES